jgi:RNA polymerase sigma-70 factor, ECF subfamily
LIGLGLENENTNYISYLIDLAQSGRPRAFIDLATINLKNVFTVSYRLLADYELAKKNTSKTFFYAWDSIKSFDKGISFPIWIKSLAIQFAIEELSGKVSYKPEPPKNLTIHPNVERLESLITSLPVIERIIFVLHDLEGFSYREINAYLDDMIIDEIETTLIETRTTLMMNLGL